MAPARLPAALSLLEDDPSPAVDAALLAAIPAAAAPVRTALVELLMQRGNAQAGVGLTRLYAQASPDVKSLIAGYVRPLHSPLRTMVASTELSDRLAAIHLIESAGDTKSAYLIAEALRHRCGRTRETAAASLRSLTDAALDAFANARGSTAAQAAQRLEEVAAALRDAIRSWDAHVQTPALHAALCLMDRTEPAVRQKVADAQSRFAHAAGHAVEHASDVRLAPAVVRCLGVPELRTAAAACIRGCRKRAFIDAVLAAAWLLVDPAVEHGCRAIRKDHWEDAWLAAVGGLPRPRVGQAVRLVAATGGPAAAKGEFFRHSLDNDDPDVRRAVLWRIVDDPSDAATRLLTSLAARTGEELAPIARRECRRRGIPSRGAAAAPADRSGASHAVPSSDVWTQTVRPDAHADRSVPPRATVREPDLPPEELSAALDPARSSAIDRIDALQRLSSSDRVESVAPAVFRACNDPEAAVRALAVALLGRVPGATSVRLLRNALHDPDPRVQANAIEALDALQPPDRSEWVLEKLYVADARVRANAVRCCLRAEMTQAAAALLDMLESDKRAHRVSALWLVEKLGLKAVEGRVHEMMESDPDQRVRSRATRVHRRLTGRPTAVRRAPHPSTSGADESK